jgi:hypothetical protein
MLDTWEKNNFKKCNLFSESLHESSASKLKAKEEEDDVESS